VSAQHRSNDKQDNDSKLYEKAGTADMDIGIIES